MPDKQPGQSSGNLPSYKDEFERWVAKIQESKWFTESWDKVLTEVFNGMSNLWLAEAKEGNDELEKYEKFIVMVGKIRKKTKNICF